MQILARSGRETGLLCPTYQNMADVDRHGTFGLSTAAFFLPLTFSAPAALLISFAHDIILNYKEGKKRMKCALAMSATLWMVVG